MVGVIRSTFVIDAEGRIERAMYNVKATGTSPSSAASWGSDGGTDADRAGVARGYRRSHAPGSASSPRAVSGQRGR